MNSINLFAKSVFLFCALCIGSCACGHSQVGADRPQAVLGWGFELSDTAVSNRRPVTLAELSDLPESLVFKVLENSNPARRNVGVAVSFEIVEKNLALETYAIHTISFFPPDQTGNFSIRLKERAKEALRRLESRPESTAFLVFTLKSLDGTNLPDGLRLKCRVAGQN
ncbi:MAG: hypothetical protein Q7T20_12400 [Saprospiraceae bacterium]|nr:hypothetical protein [Saprospiraceae bacterium]